jgi:hypothetical protein
VIRYALIVSFLSLVFVDVLGVSEVQCAEHVVAEKSVVEEETEFRQRDTEGTERANVSVSSQPLTIPILCYHRFENGSSSTYAITPEAFEEANNNKEAMRKCQG